MDIIMDISSHLDIRHFWIIVSTLSHFTMSSSTTNDIFSTFNRRPLIPRFYPTPTNVTYEEGGLAILYCSVENLGTKSVIWRKQPYNVPITVGEQTFIEIDRFNLNHVPHKDQWNLLIKNVQLFDAGVYECQVSSTTTKLRRNVTLNVIKPLETSQPEITISGPRFVNKNAQIHLTCNASGTDTPLDGIDWFKDGNLLTTKRRSDIKVEDHISIATNTVVSSLTIKKAKVNDTGTYVCRTSWLLTTGFRVHVLNAETSNVKREFDEFSRATIHPPDNSGDSSRTYFAQTYVLFTSLLSHALYLFIYYKGNV